MSVFAHEQGAADVFAAPVFADGLGDGENMGLGKRAVQAGTAMSAGSETYQLRGVGCVGLAIEIFALELTNVDQDICGRRFAGQRIDGHSILRLLTAQADGREISPFE